MRATPMRSPTLTATRPAPGYSTTVDLTEAPIAESGVWSNVGLDWTLVDTANGNAFGSQTGNGGFDDSYAHLSGFPANQMASAVIHLVPAMIDAACTHEVEIHMRWSDSAHSAQGYECNLAWDGAYSQIVRWNGALGDFTYLDAGTVPAVHGGTINASAIGDVISCTSTERRSHRRPTPRSRRATPAWASGSAVPVAARTTPTASRATRRWPSSNRGSLVSPSFRPPRRPEEIDACPTFVCWRSNALPSAPSASWRPPFCGAATDGLQATEYRSRPASRSPLQRQSGADAQPPRAPRRRIPLQTSTVLSVVRFRSGARGRGTEPSPICDPRAHGSSGAN